MTPPVVASNGQLNNGWLSGGRTERKAMVKSSSHAMRAIGTLHSQVGAANLVGRLGVSRIKYLPRPGPAKLKLQGI